MTKFLHLGRVVFNLDEVAGARPGPAKRTTRVFIRNGNMTIVEVEFGDFVDALHGAQISPYYVVTLPEALREAERYK